MKIQLPKPLRRLGCGLLLLVWFLVMLTPCFVIVLATQREIVIQYSDIPQDELRIWTIQERDLRGIGIANSRRVTVTATTGDATCTVIDIRFVLWQGQAESARSCACYELRDGAWRETTIGDAACKLAGE
jgi:hypothetical protein